MEQTAHLKQTVEKLDRALTRLQEIQSALRGHNPLPLITGDLNPDSIPELSGFHGLADNYLVQSGSQRRWSMPAPLTHDALSDAVAVSKFAKKTVDMVKVQKKKQAAKSTNASSLSSSSQAEQTSLLRPSNRINLPQPVDMSALNNSGSKLRSSSKENKSTPLRQSKLEVKNDAKQLTKAGVRSTKLVEKHTSAKSRDEASTSSNAERPNKHAYSNRIAPDEEDIQPSIFKLRALEQATSGDGIVCRTQDHNAAVKRSSLSMRTLMQMEDEENKKRSTLAAPKDGDDVDSFSSAMASKSFSVQLEEVKSSRKKSWNFTHPGKASDNVVVMFPNPTFDETTPPTNTPPEDHEKAIDATIRKKQSSLLGKASTLPSTTTENKALSSDTKGSFQKREKIVRLSPCTSSTSSNAQKLKPQLAPAVVACASTSKRVPSPKKQRWRCTLTHPPSPTLIRRLPEAHEMKEIKRTTQNSGDGEDTHSVADHVDDDQNSLGRSWSFGNPSTHGSWRTSSEARRSSLNPPAGGQAFSFLSKHFHAWKLSSKPRQVEKE